MKRLLVLLATCALLAALSVPSAASAARPLTLGFSDTDTNIWTGATPAERNVWLNRAVESGSGIIRIGVEWPVISPNRPPDPTNPGSASYDFSAVDEVVVDAKAHGLKVLLSVNHVPAWAEGPGRNPAATQYTWRPNIKDVADFMQAVAARYNGNFNGLPAAESIEVWDEPNSSDWLNPQIENGSFTGAAIYREMLNASYPAIKSVNPRVQVVTGATAPYGDAPGGPFPNGLPRSRPVTFWQQVLCVRPVKSKVKKKKKSTKPPPTKYVRSSGCNGPVQFDVFAHHPIDNTGGGPLKSGPTKDDASTPDLARVVDVLRGAEKVGTVSRTKHPVWVTEFWWDTNPPNPVGASPGKQARWIEQSLYLFWKAGADTVINFQIADGPDRPNVHAGFQSGIYTADGRPKTSFIAWTFPFVTERLTTTKITAWGKAPESGKLLIQRRQGSKWITEKKLKVSKGATFITKLKLPGKQSLRASVAGKKSLVWKQSATVPGTKTKKSGDGGSGISAKVWIPLIGLTVVALVLTTFRLRARRRTADGRGSARTIPAKPA